MTPHPGSPRRLRPLALAVLCAIAFASPAACDDAAPDPQARLRSMTREQREALVRNLSRFDDLPREQKDAARQIDKRLAALEPAVRDRYLAILRRYHTIYNGLPADRRKALDRITEPGDKLKKLLEFQQERAKAGDGSEAQFQDDLQWSSLAPRRIHQTARELIVWFNLDQPEDAKLKAEYARTNDPTKRRALMEGAVRTRRSVMQQLRQEFGEFLTEEEFLVMLHDFQAQEPKLRVEAQRRAKGEAAKVDEKKKTTEVERLVTNQMIRERETFTRNWVADHMRKLEPEALRAHDGVKVDPANLSRFIAALPPWAWESIDLLPPEAARRRLKVLYRLVFPPGKEMPMPRPESRSPADKPKPPPTPPPSGNSKTF